MYDSNLSPSSRENLLQTGVESNPIERPSSVTFSTHRSRVFCSHCQQIVTVVTVAEAARLFNTDLQDIQFLLGKDDIHAVRQDQGVISICRASLENCFESRQTRLLDSHFEIAVQQTRDGQIDD